MILAVIIVEPDFVLIETLWNVKKVGALIIFRNGSRINRNIVECKEITIHLHSEHGLRINRNIVECKETGVLTQPVNPGVLIETLWNVKMCSTYSAQPLLTVLIETLWNVKLGLL